MICPSAHRPLSVLIESMLGNLGPLSFLPVGMSASLAAAATAAVVTEPEKDFSSCAPAARTTGTRDWEGPSSALYEECISAYPLMAQTNMQYFPVKFSTLAYRVSVFPWASLLWTAHLQLARMVSALQQQQQQQRQPSMKHSPSHPVGPKPHLDNMVPNTLNVGLPDLQTKGPIPGYGSGELSVIRITFF